MFKKYRWFSVYILFTACSPVKAPKQQEVLALREMNELVTVEYVVNKIIKASDDKTWYKVGDRKILMTCEATLKAGIDFSKIDENNIVIDGKNITLTLPPASLFSISIKPEDIKVAYEEVGAFRTGFSSAERDQLAAQAQEQIKSSADSLGVLHTAEANASLFVSNLLRNMGYEKVIVSFSNNPALPKLN